MLLLAVIGLLLFVSVVVRLSARVAQPAPDAGPDPSPASRAWAAVRDRRSRLPLLPEGHRPPPGLGPLSPSERFLTTETQRGIRALQLWLLDQDGASA